MTVLAERPRVLRFARHDNSAKTPPAVFSNRKSPSMAANTAPAANNLEAFFMPFTANRQFKKNPRLLARAKGVHYWTPEGRKVIDGTAGLWCVNAGHGREEIKQAIAAQLEEMDFAPTFQMGHPK